MSSPGGTDEVGRVSIRVLPDTGGFRQRLQAAVERAESGLEVRIPVDFDVNTDGLRAQIQALELSKITIPVDLGDGSEIERLRTRLQALENSRITIPVELDLQNEARINAVLQRLRNRTMDLRVRMHGVNQALRDLTALEAMVRRLDGRRININVDVDAAGAIAQIAAIQAALTGLRGSIGSLSTASGGMNGAFRRMTSTIMGAVAAAALLPPIATALVVAGAGISAAWGAISTAILAIPPAILLLAAPIATIATGMDGIKAAAKSLNPEVEKLRSLLNTTFERGFTRVFETLRAIFPPLTAGMHDTAHAIINIAQNLATMLASEPGLARIETVFKNINTALNAMSPGIAAIVDGFLILGSQSSIFDLLSTAVNTFGSEFRAAILRVTEGSTTLETAMRGLSGLLDELTQGFFHLVTNGMELFAAAAPGVNRFLDSLTSFFGRFDWTALGTAVSNVFDGIARGLDKIPQGTIDRIVAGFEKLGQTFQDPAFQQGLAGWAELIPPVLDGLNMLTQAFGQVGRDMTTIIEFVSRVGQALSGLGSILEGVGLMAITFAERLINPFMSNERFEAQIAEAKAAITNGMKGIHDAFTRPWPAIQQTVDIGMTGVNGAIITGAERSGVAAAGALDTGIGEMNNAAERGLKRIPPTVKEGLAPVAPAVTSGMAPVPGAVTTALSPAEQALADAIAKFPPVIQQGFANLSGPVAAGMTAIVQGINDGALAMTGSMDAAMVNVASSVTAGMANVQTALVAGTTGWSLAVGTAFQGVQLVFTTSFSQLGTIATQGMIGVQTAMTAGTTGWSLAIGTAMQQVMLTFTTSFSQLGTIATQGMIGIQTAMTAGTAGWTLAVGLAMQQVMLTLTTGFSQLATIATSGMLQVQTAITTGATFWANSITQGFVGMTAAMQTGFAQMAAIALGGMALFATSITSGFAAAHAAALAGMSLIAGAVTNGFALVAAAVTTGMAEVNLALTTNWAAAEAATATAMTNMSTAVTAGMAAMVVAVATGAAEMTAQTVSAMSAMQAAIQTGMNASAAVVRMGVSTMVNVLSSAVPQFRDAGSNMGRALADGLRSQLGAVRAAAQALADAAAAGVRAAAAIRSPSRVFIALGEQMGAGLEQGLREARSGVVTEAERMTNAVVNSVSGIQDALALDSWASDFNARVNAELGAQDMSTPTPASGGTVINNNFYTESSTRESAAVAQVTRRQVSMGMFGDPPVVRR